MMMETLPKPDMLVIAAALAAAYLVIQRLRAWNRLRHVKGPRSSGWFDLWMLRRAWSGSLYEDLGELCDQYGT